MIVFADGNFIPIFKIYDFTRSINNHTVELRFIHSYK